MRNGFIGVRNAFSIYPQGCIHIGWAGQSVVEIRDLIYNLFKEGYTHVILNYRPAGCIAPLRNIFHRSEYMDQSYIETMVELEDKVDDTINYLFN